MKGERKSAYQWSPLEPSSLPTNIFLLYSKSLHKRNISKRNVSKILLLSPCRSSSWRIVIYSCTASCLGIAPSLSQAFQAYWDHKWITLVVKFRRKRMVQFSLWYHSWYIWLCCIRILTYRNINIGMWSCLLPSI